MGPNRGEPLLDTPVRDMDTLSHQCRLGAAMIVRNIIDTKSLRQIVTMKPADTVGAAVETLSKHRIGAVIVSRDGAIVDGILSERDIVRALGTRGVSCLELQVQDLMTAEVIACHPDDTAISVMEKMTDGRFRHMPVVENNGMIGVISIGDVVKARIAEIQTENAALTDMISNSW
jgi:CBS domain-containing protein